MPKNDYSIIAFFENEKPKKWKYVDKIDYFVDSFLDKKHQAWSYINVYNRNTGKFLKRFYAGQSIPKYITLFCLTFILLWSCHYNTFNGFNYTSTIQTL